MESPIPNWLKPIASAHHNQEELTYYGLLNVAAIALIKTLDNVFSEMEHDPLCRQRERYLIRTMVLPQFRKMLRQVNGGAEKFDKAKGTNLSTTTETHSAYLMGQILPLMFLEEDSMEEFQQELNRLVQFYVDRQRIKKLVT